MFRGCMSFVRAPHRTTPIRAPAYLNHLLEHTRHAKLYNRQRHRNGRRPALTIRAKESLDKARTPNAVADDPFHNTTAASTAARQQQPLPTALQVPYTVNAYICGSSAIRGPFQAFDGVLQQCGPRRLIQLHPTAIDSEITKSSYSTDIQARPSKPCSITNQCMHTMEPDQGKLRSQPIGTGATAAAATTGYSLGSKDQQYAAPVTFTPSAAAIPAAAVPPAGATTAPAAAVIDTHIEELPPTLLEWSDPSADAETSAPAAAAAAAAAAGAVDPGSFPGFDQPVCIQGFELQHSQHQQQQQPEGDSGMTADAAGDKPQNQPKEKPPSKPRPTHFMALQVSHSPKVIASMASIQRKLIEADPHLKPCCLEPVTAHITIMVLHLQQQEQLDAAEAALAELGAVLAGQGLSAPLQLQLQGLSHFKHQLQLQGLSYFKHQVLYLDVAPGPSRDLLMTVGSTIIQYFSSAAGGSLLVPGEDKPFIPHITVAKTSRLMGQHKRGRRGKGRVKIPEEAWQEFADLDCGHVTINEIQICSMQGRKPGQYYKVSHRLKLQEPAVSMQPPPAEAAEAAAAQPAAMPAAPAIKKRRSPLTAARQRFKHLLSAVMCGGPKRHKPGSKDNR